jgi:hypothetical protein
MLICDQQTLACGICVYVWGVGGWTRPKASKTATAPRQNEGERKRTGKTCGERKQQSQCSRNVFENEMHTDLTLVQQRRRPIEAAGFGGR